MPPAWNSGTTYPQGAQVTFGGAVYGSLANGNLNNEPDTSPTWWVATPLWASKIVGYSVTLPQLQISKLVGYAVSLPELQVSKLTGYAVSLPQLQVSKMVAYAVLFPAPQPRAWVLRASYP